jgi:cytochrome c oxidase subunit 4
MALTLLTTAVSFVDLGPFSAVVAILIACAKGSLIVMFFMHMIRSDHLVRVIAVGALVWFLLLMSTVGDYITRGWLPIPGK